MNLVIKLCRWFDGFAMKLGDFTLVILPAVVVVLFVFVAVFHLATAIIGKFI